MTGLTVGQREKHIVFEYAPSPPPEPDGTAIATQEWLDTITKARELAIMQSQQNGSYSGDSALELSSQISSPAASSLGGGGQLGGGTDSGPGDFFGRDSALDGVNIPTTSRLRKEEDSESLRKGRKRFSRRQSKGGLAAVF